MKLVVAWLGLFAVFAAIPAAVPAAPALRGIMHAWRAVARDAHDMLTGRAPFDEAAIRGALQRYVADAGRIASEVNGRTASAHDFRARFVAFQGDAQTALGDVGRRSALQTDFTRLLTDCQSCHHAYNN